jgi:hypothetical protein
MGDDSKAATDCSLNLGVTRAYGFFTYSTLTARHRMAVLPIQVG